MHKEFLIYLIYRLNILEVHQLFDYQISQQLFWQSTELNSFITSFVYSQYKPVARGCW